ncbi:MAG: hypothetical protein ACOCQO_03075, partial [Halanaerobiaceae bacterium]
MFFYLRPVILQVLIVIILIHYLLFRRIPVLTRRHSIVVDGNRETVELTPAFYLSFTLFIILLIPA